MPIEATFSPLAPGKLLVDPERVVGVPEMPESHPMYDCSRRIMMNVVTLDEGRVVVSAGGGRFVRTLRGWGCEPIECPFWAFETIAGGFHWATIDIRRRGTLKSCF